MSMYTDIWQDLFQNTIYELVICIASPIFGMVLIAIFQQSSSFVSEDPAFKSGEVKPVIY